MSYTLPGKRQKKNEFNEYEHTRPPGVETPHLKKAKLPRVRNK